MPYNLDEFAYKTKSNTAKRWCKDDLLRKTKGLNSRRLAEERFDRQLTYLNIVNLIIKTN